MGRPTDPIPSVTLQVLRELAARRDSRPDLVPPPVDDDGVDAPRPDAAETPTDEPAPTPPRP